MSDSSKVLLFPSAFLARSVGYLSPSTYSSHHLWVFVEQKVQSSALRWYRRPYRIVARAIVGLVGLTTSSRSLPLPNMVEFTNATNFPYQLPPTPWPRQLQPTSYGVQIVAFSIFIILFIDKERPFMGDSSSSLY